MPNAIPVKTKDRVVVYVDGFNLYFGMLEAGLDDCKWLDIKALITSLLRPNQSLVAIKYFTSRVSNDPDKQKRQITYLEALESTGIQMSYGRYQTNHAECRRCGHVWVEPHEKMTDVNIATQMIIDAYQDQYDTAVLISGDSDLVPPIQAVHANFAKKQVAVFFPPKRHNNTVAIAAKGSLVIGKKKLKDNQLPPEVVKKDGFILRKPKEWS